MRDDDHGNADPLIDLGQGRQQRSRRLTVQRRGRLVAEQYLGPRRQRPGDRHPLLLPARQLGRIAVDLVAERDQLQALANAGINGRAGLATMNPQREGDVLEHRRVLDQVELLEDHPDPLPGLAQCAPRQRGQLLAGDKDATGIGSLQQIDQPQQRRLAGPALADQPKDLALAHRQRQRLDSGKDLATGKVEGLAHAIEADHGVRVCGPGHLVTGREPEPASLRRPVRLVNEENRCCLCDLRCRRQALRPQKCKVALSISVRGSPALM